MADQAQYERFLEPVYLNEKMVLNCAAYLFKGVPLQTETNETVDQNQGVSITAAVPFLGELLGLPKFEGGIRSGSMEENRSARRYTAGGLHMAVLDELQRRRMVQSRSVDHMSAFVSTGEAYVVVHTVLRPSDYYSLIGTLKILGPLVAQVFRDFGDRILPAGRSDFFDHSKLKDSVDGYEQSIMSLIDKLERDYLTSNQLEMILWSGDGSGAPVGIVDLDVTDYEPNELRSKLSGGKYHVIGKMVGRVEYGRSLDLMQKTILSNTIELVQRIMSLQEDEEALQLLHGQLAPLQMIVKRFLRLEIPGPAVRIAAMSVCI